MDVIFNHRSAIMEHRRRVVVADHGRTIRWAVVVL
jgi:hypothetical protein